MISQSKTKPTEWKRFIDDIFSLWDSDKKEINLFIEQANNFHPTIKFTVNIVERGLFNYSPDRIIPIKPSLYGVDVNSFLGIPVENFCVDSNSFPLEACWYLKENFNRSNRLAEFQTEMASLPSSHWFTFRSEAISALNQ